MNLSGLLAIMGVNLLAAMNPGPDFALVVRHSISYSRKVGLATVGGVVLGNLLHLLMGFLGLALVIKQSPLAQATVQVCGGGYLIYLGIKGLRTSGSSSGNSVSTLAAQSERSDLTPTQALTAGFLTGATNVQAALYFMGLATTLVTPQLRWFEGLAYIVVLIGTSGTWFTFLALVMSNERMQQTIQPVRIYIERITAVALLALGTSLVIMARGSLNIFM